MSRSEGGRLGALAFLLLTTACAAPLRGPAAEKSETVEAEGWAPVDPNDPAGTKARALAEAQKKAVEKVAGVYVQAQTKVEASVTVRQRIMAGVRGFVRRYEILGEREEDGFHKTRIRAVVGLSDSSAAPAPPPGNQKVAVTILAKGPQALAWEGAAEAAARQQLLAGGFASAEAGGSADLLLRGEVEARAVSDARLGGFSSSRAKIRLQAVDAESRAVIWEKSLEASALAESAEGAAVQAVENAGAAIGAAAAKDLSALLWSR